MKLIISATIYFGLTIFALIRYPALAQNLDNQEGQQNNLGLNTLRNMMSVSIPVFYDMIKDGSSLGINVLQGLVKVDRGNEAIRTGLQGPRPLSVRVFGIPVYERGTRIRSPNQTFRPQPNPQPQPSPKPQPEDFGPSEIPNTIEVNDDDELPIIP